MAKKTKAQKLVQELKNLLEEALKENEFSPFFAYLEEHSELATQPLGKRGDTLLHYLCELKLDDKEEKPYYQATNADLIEVMKQLITDFDLDSNSKDKNGETPLDYARANNNSSLVEFLEELEDKLSDILDTALRENEFSSFFDYLEQNRTAVDRSLNQNGGTLLHDLCSLKLEEAEAPDMNSEEESYQVTNVKLIKVIKQLMEEFELDVNSTDMYGNTPLYYAVANNNPVLVKFLLGLEEVDINHENHQGATALSLASTKKYRDMEQLLLAKMGHRVNEAQIPEEMTVKEFKKQQKSAIRAQGRLYTPPERLTEISIIDALASQMYAEEGSNINQIGERLAQANQEDVFQPLLQFLATCALGANMDRASLEKRLTKAREMLDENKEAIEGEDKEVIEQEINQVNKALNKRFKVIFNNREHLKELFPLEAEDAGLYTGKNTVFVAAGLELKEEAIFGALLHEATHYAMQQLFHNKANPYLESTKTEFEKMMQVTEAQLKKVQFNLSTEEELMAHEILSGGFSYGIHHRASELIARLPQVLGVLGHAKGYAWLKQTTPELLGFFEDKINPELQQFVKDHPSILSHSSNTVFTSAYYKTEEKRKLLESLPKTSTPKEEAYHAFMTTGAKLLNFAALPEALECFTKASQINSETAEPLNTIAFLLGLVGKYDIALEYYKKAYCLELTDEAKSANLVKQGELFIHVQDQHSAIEVFAEALRLNQNNKDAEEQLEQLHELSEEYPHPEEELSAEERSIEGTRSFRAQIQNLRPPIMDENLPKEERSKNSPS